jgi:cell wall-associated NlpC family hydrolase
VANPSRSRSAAAFLLAACTAAVCACAAGAKSPSWAAQQIAAVTKAGILGSSPAGFKPQSELTQAALAAATRAADAAQEPAGQATATAAPPATLTGSFGSGAVLAGTETLTIDAPGRALDHVDFAVDGTGIATATVAPFALALDTSKLADGAHQLAVNAWFVGGGHAIAVFGVVVANDGESAPTTPAVVALPIAKSTLPPVPAPPTEPAATHTLYDAKSPGAAVTMKQLDAALVAYLGLGDAARKIQATLTAAGLQPPPNTGTEAVSRMLGLRLNHPAADDSLELLPNQAATRAEAAYSFARVLTLDDAALSSVEQAAASFTAPALTPWQKRILTTAIHYVGYPYIWGGTSPGPETLFGVHSAGGFDCSGFVWRVYKLTPYDGEGDLASVLRGRTTYQMSGEVPRSARIPAAKLQPADVMFFGERGPKSTTNVVDHAAIYLGNGWFVQSSGEGVTLLPFAGYYTSYFAWGRRPLREAGLTS